MAGSREPRGRQRGNGGEDPVNLIAALNHEIRRQVLRRLEASDDALSPAQLARSLKRPLGTVSYHVRVLAGYRAARRVAEVPVRGAVEHFYVSTLEGNELAQALLEETRAGDEAPKQGS